MTDFTANKTLISLLERALGLVPGGWEKLQIQAEFEDVKHLESAQDVQRDAEVHERLLVLKRICIRMRKCFTREKHDAGMDYADHMENEVDLIIDAIVRKEYDHE